MRNTEDGVQQELQVQTYASDPIFEGRDDRYRYGFQSGSSAQRQSLFVYWLMLRHAKYRNYDLTVIEAMSKFCTKPDLFLKWT